VARRTKAKNCLIMDFKVVNTLTQAGAIGGIIYGISKQKGFWSTAGYTILFAVAGGVLGTAINTMQNK
jgi:hypothetical protein